MVTLWLVLTAALAPLALKLADGEALLVVFPLAGTAREQRWVRSACSPRCACCR